MPAHVIIYVLLPDEAVEVRRPVTGEHVVGNHYRIVEQPYDKSTERWQFEPGDRVICQPALTDNGEVLNAIARVAGPASLEPLEAAVLTKLFTGDHPVIGGLRRQLEGATAAKRRHTGVGFFTEFAVDPSAPRVGIDRLRFGDVEATIDGLANGAGFVVYVDEGYLTMLEGYSYDEPWPPVITNFAVRYSDPTRRSLLTALATLKEALAEWQKWSVSADRSNDGG